MNIGKNKVLIAALTVLGCAVLLFGVLIGTHVICISHKWQPATCTEAQTCKYCGITEGAPSGHMWEDATCTEPKTCEVCGKTKGTAQGHTWEAATCIEPKTCTACGLVEGNVLEHTWTEATCTEAQTCTVCGEIGAEALGHAAGEEKIIQNDIVAGYFVTGKVCANCAAPFDTKTTQYDTFIAGDRFLLTPAQMMDRAENAMREISGCYLTAGTRMKDDTLFGVVWDTDGSAVFVTGFLEIGEDAVATSTQSNKVRGILGYCYDEDYLVYILMGIERACDPSMSFDESKDVGTAILKAYQSGDSYTYNGIQYILTFYDGSWILGVTIDD